MAHSVVRGATNHSRRIETRSSSLYCETSFTPDVENAFGVEGLFYESHALYTICLASSEINGRGFRLRDVDDQQ